MNVREHHLSLIMSTKLICKLLTIDEFDLLNRDLQFALIQMATYGESTDVPWWPDYISRAEAIAAANMTEGIVECDGCINAYTNVDRKQCH